MIVTLIENDNQIIVFEKYFRKQFIYITIFAGSIGLIKFTLENIGLQLNILAFDGKLPFGASLKKDHNFFCLCMLIGLIYLLYDIYRNKTINTKNIIFLFVYSFSIVFTSSRRGLVLLLIILFVLIVINIKNYKSYKNLTKRILLSLSFFFLISLSIFAIIITYGRHTGVGNFNFRVRFASLFYDYQSIISPNTDFSSVYSRIWKLDYEQEYRDNTIYKQLGDINEKEEIVYANKNEEKPIILDSDQIIVRNTEMIPGWRQWMGIEIRNNSNYSDSLIQVTGYTNKSCFFRFITIDTIVDKVYFDLKYKINNWNYLSLIEIRIGNIRKRIPFDPSNLKKWQKLSFSIPINGQKSLQLIFFVTGNGIDDTGNILFKDIAVSTDTIYSSGIDDPDIDEIITKTTLNKELYRIPLDSAQWEKYGDLYFHHKQIDGKSVILTHSNKNPGGIYYDMRIPETQLWIFSTDVYRYEGSGKIRIEAEDLRKNQYSRAVYPIIKSYNIDLIEPIYLEAIFFAKKDELFRFSLKHFPDTTVQNIIWTNVHLKTWSKPSDDLKTINSDKYLSTDVISKIKHENLYSVEENVIEIYNDNKIIEKSDTVTIQLENRFNNSLLGSRMSRWQYSLILFKEYSLSSKIFGKNFNYIESFMNYFHSEQQGFDYPHNILITVLLYSGILGLIIFLWFVIKTIWLYIKLKLYQHFIAYTMIWIFTLVSSNTMFELPLLTAYSLLPYIFAFFNLPKFTNHYNNDKENISLPTSPVR